MREEINIINNKIKEQENIINNNNQIFEDIFNNVKVVINNKIKIFENNFNKKMKEQENFNDVIKKDITDIKYDKKINYKFIEDPKKLKFKSDITKTNTSFGWNDRFEIYISYKENKEYLVSINSIDFNLDIYDLNINEKIKSLIGHKNRIRTVRYFINDIDKNEYLISADDNKIVIIWDVSNNHKIKHLINTNYGDDIYSCLMVFPHDKGDNYIITSTFYDSGLDKNSATKIYSLIRK